jgi:hypothetical protein
MIYKVQGGGGYKFVLIMIGLLREFFKIRFADGVTVSEVYLDN